MSKSKKTVVALVLLAVLVAAMVLVWYFFGPDRETDSFSKTVTVAVVHGDGSEKEFEIGTNEEYLRGALEQEALVTGDESEFGLYIKAVDGETADEDAQQWWCVCDGEGNMLMTGVDDTPIHDGDSFMLILKTGYDEF